MNAAEAAERHAHRRSARWSAIGTDERDEAFIGRRRPLTMPTLNADGWTAAATGPPPNRNASTVSPWPTLIRIEVPPLHGVHKITWRRGRDDGRRPEPDRHRPVVDHRAFDHQRRRPAELHGPDDPLLASGASAGSFRLPSPDDPARSDQASAACRTFWAAAPADDRRWLPIAVLEHGGWLVLGVGGTNWGEVQSRFCERPAHPRRSLAEFLYSLGVAALPPEDRDWVRMIRDGDLAGVVRWLDAGASLFARDDRTNQTALTHAVGHRQPAIVRELLARGAEPTPGLLRLADDMGNRTVFDLISDALPPRGP